MSLAEQTQPEEAEYSAVAFGSTHSYFISDGAIRYRWSRSNAEFSIDLRDNELKISRGREFHPGFFRGVVALGGGGLTCAEIVFIQHESLLQYPLVIVFPAIVLYGLYALIRYCRSIRCWRIKTPAGDQLTVFEDPTNREAATAFIEQIRTA